MPSSRIPSPARSQGVISTPRKDKLRRRTRSVCSPTQSNVSVRLSTLVSYSYKISPMPNRQSVLTDETDIEIVPGRQSWWKKLGDNSRDVMDVLETKDMAEIKNVADEFDVEVLSQEKQNYTLDLPESSDGESISSIVIPQRKLFTEKEHNPQKKFAQILNNRDSQSKHKSHIDHEKDIEVAPKNLFSQPSKPRNKPVFPAALLNISSDKTMNKTKEMPIAEVKGQVRSLFGNRPAAKRKNMFADFIVSDSEDEIPDIQPKVFGFQRNVENKRRESSSSQVLHHSPRSSIDLELDDWKLLPSSTMVGNQLEDTTPVKRARLSKLSEDKETETLSTINKSLNKTKQSNKLNIAKNKSKISSNSKLDVESSKLQYDNINVNGQSDDQAINNSNSRLTRNKSKSIRENSLIEANRSKTINKSKNITNKDQSIVNKVNDNQENINLLQNEENIQNERPQDVGEDDEDFTLEYENDDEQNNECLDNNANGRRQSKDKNETSNKNTLDKEKQSVHEITNKSNKQENTNKSRQNNVNMDIDMLDGNAAEKPIQLNNEPEIQNIINENLNESENVKNKTNISHNTSKNHNKSKNKQDEIVEAENEVNQENHNNTRQNKKSQIESNNVNQEMEHEDDNQESKPISEENEEENDNNEQINTEENEEENESNEQGNAKDNEENESNEQNNTEGNEEENVSNKQNNTEENEDIASDIEDQNENQEIENESQEDETDQIDSEQERNESDIQYETEEMEKNQELNESDKDEEDESDNVKQNDEGVTSNHEEEENESTVNKTDEQLNESVEIDENEEEDEENEEQDIENEDQKVENDEQEMENEEQDMENEDQDVENEEQEMENEDQDVENEEEEEDVEQEIENDDQESNESEVEENEDENEQVDHDGPIEEENDNEDEEVTGNENDESPNITHDTTGRHRNIQKVTSPEAILHDKTNQIDSFMAEGRNTSVRKTKSILVKTLNIRPSLAPVRESTGFSDGTRNSSADNSGWDSHRTTRKTIRETFGKEFTTRKSLRALVMEKSAKRHTNFMEKRADLTENVDNTKIPQANSTELPHFDSYEDPEPGHVDETTEESDRDQHEMSKRTRQTTLEMYLQKIKQDNLERKRKIEEQVRNSLKTTTQTYNLFKVPRKPVRRVKPAESKPRTKQTRPLAFMDMLPAEVIEDMKYKPPKRFKPNNASWITKRLYKFLETKLEPNYDYKARVRSEKLVETIYNFTKDVRKHHVAPLQMVDALKHEMARLNIVKTHFDFYEFFQEYMPREIRIKVIPDVVNNISLPKHGVFADIIR